MGSESIWTKKLDDEAVGSAFMGLLLFIFCCVGPFLCCGRPLLFLLALGLPVPAAVVYGRALFRVFGRDGAACLLMAPVVALLVLIYLDYAFLLSVSQQKPVHSGYNEFAPYPHLVEAYHAVLAPVVVRTLGNNLIHRTIGLLVPDLVGTPWAVVIAAMAKMSLLPMAAIVARGTSTRDIGPEQPAYPEYFHVQAIRDLTMVLKTSVLDVYRWNQRAIDGAVDLVGRMTFAWPLLPILVSALIPLVCMAVAVFMMAAVFHTLSLALIWLGAMWFSTALYLAELSVMFARSRYAKCPYNHCHQPVPLPVFACPACGVRHDRLVPGRFGFLWRKCECGKASLPTLFLLGKGRREAFCPHCSGAMPSALFGSNVHVPVYGGPSSGKTMLVMAEAYQMLERRWSDVSARLITARARRMYSSTWKRQYESGQAREKTRATSPDAFLMSVRRPGGLPVSLYLYDPAGEAMGAQEELRQHTFLRYMSGMMILVDPLSLPSFAERYRELEGPDLSPTTSAMDPATFVDRLLTQLEEYAGGSRVGGIQDRVAVVFTKADIPYFMEEVGSDLDTAPPDEPWSISGWRQSRQLEAWLRANEPELHQKLTTWFRQRRFFAVSATGREPAGRRAFEPRQVLHPLAWLLSGQRTLTRPVLFRWGRSLGETALAATVFSAITWVPLVGVGIAVAVGIALA